MHTIRKQTPPPNEWAKIKFSTWLQEVSINNPETGDSMFVVITFFSIKSSRSEKTYLLGSMLKLFI